MYIYIERERERYPGTGSRAPPRRNISRGVDRCSCVCEGVCVRTHVYLRVCAYGCVCMYVYLCRCVCVRVDVCVDVRVDIHYGYMEIHHDVHGSQV